MGYAHVVGAALFIGIDSMKVLELFAGNGVISEAFRKRGHEAYTVDWNESLELSLCADISTLEKEQILELCKGKPDVIWASPDCTTYSVAGIGNHRRMNPYTYELEPISEYASFCDNCNRHLIELIRQLSPRFYFIENPRGGLRTMSFMAGIPRYTVTYCQYGEERMKPTDIWTNHPNPRFFPPCKNGDPCHVRTPRHSKVGTQGLRDSLERAKIPDMLCNHIVDICENPEPIGIDCNSFSIGAAKQIRLDGYFKMNQMS
jgi:hypothetical protein